MQFGRRRWTLFERPVADQELCARGQHVWADPRYPSLPDDRPDVRAEDARQAPSPYSFAALYVQTGQQLCWRGYECNATRPVWREISIDPFCGGVTGKWELLTTEKATEIAGLPPRAEVLVSGDGRTFFASSRFQETARND